MLPETTEYDPIFDSGVKFDIFGFCNVSLFSSLTLTAKTASLKHASDKVLRANWPRGTYGDIMFLSKSGPFNWICDSNLDFDFAPPLLLCLCLIHPS